MGDKGLGEEAWPSGRILALLRPEGCAQASDASKGAQLLISPITAGRVWGGLKVEKHCNQAHQEEASDRLVMSAVILGGEEGTGGNKNAVDLHLC